MRVAMAATALAVAVTAPSLAPAQDAAPRGQGLMGRLFSRTTPSSAPTVQPPAPSNPPPASTAGAARPTTDSRVFKTGDTLPEPVAYDDMKPPAIPLPTEPLEPYLLTKDNGPFMVMAKTFRGPNAARYAQALAIELRNDCKLPAYIFFLKIKPMQEQHLRRRPDRPAEHPLGPHEPGARYRVYDEAAVLVGNCKTIAEASKLLRTVKAVHSRTIDALPNPYPWRRGSRGADHDQPLRRRPGTVPGHSVVPAQGGTVDPSAFPIVGPQSRPPDPQAEPGAPQPPEVPGALHPAGRRVQRPGRLRRPGGQAQGRPRDPTT